jgi:hypothetical protein
VFVFVDEQVLHVVFVFLDILLVFDHSFYYQTLKKIKTYSNKLTSDHRCPWGRGSDRFFNKSPRKRCGSGRFLKIHRGSGRFLKIHRGSGRFLKIHRGSGRFFKIHRGSGSIFFEDIEKVHEFDRILVFTSETL